jgi:hypothetical protein
VSGTGSILHDSPERRVLGTLELRRAFDLGTGIQ